MTGPKHEGKFAKEWFDLYQKEHAVNEALVESLKAMPLESFGDEMSKCDAADFVDHSGEFFEAMIRAKAALKLAEEGI